MYCPVPVERRKTGYGVANVPHLCFFASESVRVKPKCPSDVIVLLSPDLFHLIRDLIGARPI